MVLFIFTQFYALFGTACRTSASTTGTKTPPIDYLHAIPRYYTLLEIKIASKSTLLKAINQNKKRFCNGTKKSDYLNIGIDSVCAILHVHRKEQNTKYTDTYT